MRQAFIKIITASALLLMLLLATSCNGFFEPEVDIPVITGVTVTGESAAELQMKITWSAVPESGGYHIYRSEDGGTFAYIGSTGPSQLTYLDVDDLELGSSYRYRVSAYGIWHTTESEGSIPSAAVAFFLPPVWETVLNLDSVQPLLLKTILAPAGELYVVYADTSGLLHIGNLVEEEDPDNEDETVFIYSAMEDPLFNASVSPLQPDFSITFGSGALYIAYADSTESNKATVIQIEPYDDEDELVWDWETIGIPGFTDTAASSVSISASGGITQPDLYLSYLQVPSGTNPVRILTRPADDETWYDISPAEAEDYNGQLPLHSSLMLSGGSPLLAYVNDDESLHILKRIDITAGGWNWTEAYPSLPVFNPADNRYQIVTPQFSPAVMSWETASGWNIQIRQDNEWLSIDGTADEHDEQFSAVSADLIPPFSAAATGDQIIVLASSGTGPVIIMYDRDLAKWFPYGSPAAVSGYSSPSMLISGETLYSSWIGSGNLYIAVGR